jgi:hypothetical protein
MHIMIINTPYSKEKHQNILHVFQQTKVKRLGENTIIIGEIMFIFDKRKELPNTSNMKNLLIIAGLSFLMASCGPITKQKWSA